MRAFFYAGATAEINGTSGLLDPDVPRGSGGDGQVLDEGVERIGQRISHLVLLSLHRERPAAIILTSPGGTFCIAVL